MTETIRERAAAAMRSVEESSDGFWTWEDMADAILNILSEPGEEDAERVARGIMLNEGCGMTLEGARVFCNDPRLPDDMRLQYPCECRSSARAAIKSYVSGGEG